MRKTILVTTLALAATAFAAGAHAGDTLQIGTYGKVGVSSADYGEKFTALNLGYGIDLSPHVALEADANFGLSDKTMNVNGFDVKTKLNYDLGAFVVGKLPLSPNVNLTGRLGYMTAKVQASAGGYKASDTVSGAAIGIGLTCFPHGGKNGFSIDATHANYGSKNGTANIYQVSYIRRFF